MAASRPINALMGSMFIGIAPSPHGPAAKPVRDGVEFFAEAVEKVSNSGSEITQVEVGACGIAAGHYCEPGAQAREASRH